MTNARHSFTAAVGKYRFRFILLYAQLALIVVYKLVRFYLPSSEAAYVTTRATLTVFSR